MTKELKILPKCVTCKHLDKSSEVIHTQAGPRLMEFYKCSHPAFRDPVNDTMLPCVDVRKIDKFCGFEGRGHEEKTFVELAK